MEIHDDWLKITEDTTLDAMAKWLEEHGCVWEMMRPRLLEGMQHETFARSEGMAVWGATSQKPFLVLGQPGQPALIATVGCILNWDGENVTVIVAAR